MSAVNIVDRTRCRLEAEVDPIIADYSQGLARYRKAVDVIGAINTEIEAAGCWYNPFRCIDQTKAYRLTTAKAQHISDVCQAVTIGLLTRT